MKLATARTYVIANMLDGWMLVAPLSLIAQTFIFNIVTLLLSQAKWKHQTYTQPHANIRALRPRASLHLTVPAINHQSREWVRIITIGRYHIVRNLQITVGTIPMMMMKLFRLKSHARSNLLREVMHSGECPRTKGNCALDPWKRKLSQSLLSIWRAEGQCHLCTLFTRRSAQLET